MLTSNMSMQQLDAMCSSIVLTRRTLWSDLVQFAASAVWSGYSSTLGCLMQGSNVQSGSIVSMECDL